MWLQHCNTVELHSYHCSLGSQSLPYSSLVVVLFGCLSVWLEAHHWLLEGLPWRPVAPLSPAPPIPRFDITTCTCRLGPTHWAVCQSEGWLHLHTRTHTHTHTHIHVVHSTQHWGLLLSVVLVVFVLVHWKWAHEDEAGHVTLWQVNNTSQH